MLNKDLTKILLWGLIASFLVYIMGWFVNLPEGDAARLAATCLDMVQVNHIAYRVPAILATALSLIAIYRFSRLYYPIETSKLAVIILATTEAFFILNWDAANATYMTAFYSVLIWQLAAYLKTKKLQHLILCVIAAVFILFSKGSPQTETVHFKPFTTFLTPLWAFAPWTLFLLLGFWERLKNGFVRRPDKRIVPEQISLYGFLIPFILIILNPYQTAYEVFMIFPAAAVVTADYMIRSIYLNIGQQNKRLYMTHISLSYIAISLLFSIVWFPFPDSNFYGLIHFMALLTVFTWLVFFSSINNKIIISCIVLAVGANLVINSYFLPNMADYQAGARLGIMAKSDGVLAGRLFSYQAGESATLHFYTGIKPKQTNDFKKLAAMKNCWIYTHERFLDEFRTIHPNLRIVGRSDDYTDWSDLVTFLNPSTRAKKVTKKIVIRL